MPLPVRHRFALALVLALTLAPRAEAAYDFVVLASENGAPITSLA